MQAGDLWLEGKTLKEIGRLMKISHRTVETYIDILRKRYGVRNKVEMMIAMQKAHPKRPCPCCGRVDREEELQSLEDAMWDLRDRY